MSRLLNKPVTEISSILTAYAQIYFAQSPVTGFLFLTATFIVPMHGASGLLGLGLTNLFAKVIGRPREHIAEGFYGFNGLLVGLALGLYFRFSLPFIVVLVITTFLTAVLSALLRDLSERYLGIPVLSLSFVIVTWIALLAMRRFSAVEPTAGPLLATELGADILPHLVELYLRSLAAAFFQLSVLSGILIFAGLLWTSTWTVLLSIIGFAVGYWVYIGLGGVASDLHMEFVGFNFILTAIAVGGVWIVLRPASIVYAAAGAAVSAMVAAALLIFLRPMGLPVLAMPFIITTTLLLLVMVIRSDQRTLKIVQGRIGSPEYNLNRAVYQNRRYPDPTTPVLLMPVMGKWIITQGVGGETTHQGLWSHAWDFEVTDEDGAKFNGNGTRPSDYFAYGAPVVAPGEGKVVRVVSHIEDNLIGEIDTRNNWGNLVIIWHGLDLYSALCHLKKGSLKVKEGDTVTIGQVLGRVGNSGRSPVPHLHFQLQATGEIGAPTRGGTFLHYLSMHGDKTEYITHGVPRQGEIVSPLEVDEDVRRTMTLGPGRTWEWSVTRNGVTRRETWRSEIDPLGNREIVVDDEKTRIAFFADKHYITMLDFRGRPGQLIRLLYLGLARAPYRIDERLVWTDHLSGAPFLNPILRFIHDLALPLTELAAIRTTSRLEKNGASVRIVTRLAIDSKLIAIGKLPERIEITLEGGVGPTSISAFKGDDLLESAELVR